MLKTLFIKCSLWVIMSSAMTAVGMSIGDQSAQTHYVYIEQHNALNHSDLLRCLRGLTGEYIRRGETVPQCMSYCKVNMTPEAYKKLEAGKHFTQFVEVTEGYKTFHVKIYPMDTDLKSLPPVVERRLETPDWLKPFPELYDEKATVAFAHSGRPLDDYIGIMIKAEQNRPENQGADNSSMTPATQFNIKNMIRQDMKKDIDPSKENQEIYFKEGAVVIKPWDLFNLKFNETRPKWFIYVQYHDALTLNDMAKSIRTNTPLKNGKIARILNKNYVVVTVCEDQYQSMVDRGEIVVLKDGQEYKLKIYDKDATL